MATTTNNFGGGGGSNSPGGFLEGDSWFHGTISREEAQAMLFLEGTDGAFLVRESTSSIGNYAISVLSVGEVHHIEVIRHGGDAFFSVEDGPIFHGLDELVKHHQNPSAIGEDDLLLQTPVVLGGPPPPDCRRHGRTNLLHRATKEGSVEIVMEMVRCGHRSLDAKNEEGQTAAHLAAISGLNQILGILIGAGTQTNAKDSKSLTPLHYACINNLPDTVRLLLEEGGANPQVRRNDNGWVPLHEAASRGHLDCVRVLWRGYAPLRPRTLDHKLPIHLALETNQEEVVRFFDTVASRKALSNRDDWYHGRLGRQEALRSLQLCQNARPEDDPSTSYFLIRRHSQKYNVYVLTLLLQGHMYNFEIGQEGTFYYIDDGPYLDTLEHLVDHYSRWQDGLPTPLHVPVGPTQTFAQPPEKRRGSKDPSNPNFLSSSSESLQVPPPLPERTRTSPLTVEMSNNLNYGGGIGLPPFSRERIPIELLTIGRCLGGGEYGEVYEGTLTYPSSGSSIEVAVKTLKDDVEESKRDWMTAEFLREAEVMMDLEHENVVKILGTVREPRVYMVQELLALGSLQGYLQAQKSSQSQSQSLVTPERDFPKWAHEIAKGMVYLQRKKIIHRDLAARNILLSKDRVAKISDFGLSRALGRDHDYYTASSGGRWPIKWYAPESCTHGTFSHASDVWSFGISLWELWTFGDTPYGENTTGREVIEMVEKGERLEKPKHCPDRVYSVMKKCWTFDADLRPKFPFLENFFANLGTLSSRPTIDNDNDNNVQEEETPNNDNENDNVYSNDNNDADVDADNNLNQLSLTTNSLESLQLIEFN